MKSPVYIFKVKNTVNGSEFIVELQTSKVDADKHMKFTYPYPIYIVTLN